MRILVLCALLLLVACAEAESGDFKQTLQKRLSQAFPSVTVTSISEAPMEGMYEVTFKSRGRAYVTANGRYMFVGTLFKLTDQGVLNVTQRHLRDVRRKRLSRIDIDQTITFAAEEQKAELFVFTDVTCPYCRQFHAAIDRINELGITVHYLAFPRGGMNAPAADLMQKVWCAEDSRAAMTEAKATGELDNPPEPCANPVREQFQLGLKMDVHGTPTLFTASGHKIGGYLPPEALARVLNIETTGSEN